MSDKAIKTPAMNTASPRLIPDAECAQSKCACATTGCWGECSLKRNPIAMNTASPTESAVCEGCNGYGMVGNILDSDTCPFCHGSGETTAIAGSGPDGYEVAVNCDSCGGTGAVDQGSATKGIIPDADHVAALALSGALKEPHAKQILRDAFKKPDQGSATSGEAVDYFKAWAATTDGNCNRVNLREYSTDSYERRIEGVTFISPLVERDWTVWQASRAALAASAEQSRTPVPREVYEFVLMLTLQSGGMISGNQLSARAKEMLALLDAPVSERAATKGENDERALPAASGGDAPAEHAIEGVSGHAGADAGASQVAERAAAPASVPEEPVELIGVARQMDEGAGFWQTCSGCHESEDGHDVGRYAYSSALRCKLGNGCSECGGLGAVWDNNDYAEWAAAEQNAAPEVAQPAAQGESIEEILRGIDDTEVSSEEGWWETSSGAKFGAEKLAQVIKWGASQRRAGQLSMDAVVIQWGEGQRRYGRRAGIEEAAALFDTSPHAEEFRVNIAELIRALKSLATPAPTVAKGNAK